MSRASDLAWCRAHFASMADGGVWGVPRSGLVFCRRGEALVLVERMPWTSEMAEAAELGRDVPGSEEELRAYQDADYETIRGRFEAAGITVTDERKV